MDKIIKHTVRKNDSLLFTSVITLIEVLILPLRQKKFDIVDKYRNLLLNSDDFTMYSIDPIIAEKSSEIRAKYNFKTPEAIQLAVAIQNNATLFITNDNDLKKINSIEVLVIEKFV